ncbi:MAG: hypothetical protein O7C98_03210 [Planctomycetota bacterium]|nr:hypothetical protein [Planctomycetota bacterium]
MAGRSAEFVSLPLLSAALPASVFRAVAPAAVLCECACLRLYVGYGVGGDMWLRPLTP